MKLYEVNQAIEGIFEILVNPETGEILPDETLLAQLDALQMERSRILEYLAKLVLNTKSQISAIKEEEQRLRERRQGFDRKVDRLMAILDRECAGEKTDCGVATVCYRKTTKVDVADSQAAVDWLSEHGHSNCYRIPAPEISKTEVKRLLTAGTEVPGVTLVQDLSCSLK
jgi:hypothetical protein